MTDRDISLKNYEYQFHERKAYAIQTAVAL